MSTMKIPDRLRHFVTLQTVTVLERSDGTVGETKTTLAESVPCEIVDTRGREYFDGRKLANTTSHVVTTRYRSDFGPKDCMTWPERNKTLNVIAIRTDNHNRFMQLDCLSDS